MFIDRLIDSIIKKKNPTVAGLDPKLEYVPEFIVKKFLQKSEPVLKAASEAIYEFNTAIIDSIYDLVPAVKLQLAYYEMYGHYGMECFMNTTRYAKEKGLIVIADGKRNDIGSTVEAYSSAYLGKVSVDEIKLPVFDADALTVNPYLGFDGIKPFLDDCRNYGKGIFILVKTSNKSSNQLQDIKTHDGKFVYELIAEYVKEWGSGITGKYGYSSIGAVVGATYPEEAATLRKIMNNSYILVPGYGAQGGTAKDAAANFNSDGLGAIVNASRSIMCAYKSEKWKMLYDEHSFASAARAEVIEMRDKILNVLN